MTQNTDGFLFSGKIYCGLCGWKYRAKKERNKKVYVCSKYSTGKAGGCERHKVDEENLLFLTGQQLKIYDLSQDRLDLRPPVKQKMEWLSGCRENRRKSLTLPRHSRTTLLKTDSDRGDFKGA